MRISFPLVCRHKFESSHFPSNGSPLKPLATTGLAVLDYPVMRLSLTCLVCKVT